MMSQTHLLVACSLFAKPGHKLRNGAVVTGAILPDLAIYGLLIWSKIANIPEAKVWRELYWQEPWQTYTALGNSLPLYASLASIGVLSLRQSKLTFRIGMVLTFIALAAMTHIAGDMPVHVQDAHRHFWPMSDWKFISPVSYWNPDHHGTLFSAFEAILGLCLSVLLFRRFTQWYLRALLVIIFTAYLAVPIYFYWQMKGF